MSFLKLIPLYYLLSFTFSLHIVLGQSTSSPDPLYHFCFNSQIYPVDGSYGKNLNNLISYLSFNVPPTGFGLGSVGRQAETRVNGLALCRGDVKSSDCKTCVVKATDEIRQRCPNDKGAIIWYDNCLFKYSNEKFFGQIDNANKFYLYNINNVTDSVSFNKKTKELITSLSTKAVVSPVLFATGEMELEGGSEKLYGLVQCTRDLSSSDCKKCLDDAVSELPSCCDGKRGGRVIGGSCNLRYELYPFVNA
ncbi:Gnk2-homologous domain [Macleaya cordata]|uniref:Gnk2-homologous domain n=1 Tax=Macleaya cordata TaxID=56857 RepID=A0A200QY20_MACCD|nr:Gnk2-homologous domain [Macleaya cordata]